MMVGNEPMASVVLRLFVQLYLLLLPARPIVIQSVSQSNFSGCLWTLVAVMQLIPSFSSLSSGSERGRQYQQVLRRSHVVGAGQAGRGAQLPDVRQQIGAPSAAGPGGAWGVLSVIISTLLHRIQSESTRTQVSLHHECIS